MIIVIICYLIILINLDTNFIGVFIRYRSVVVINFAKTSLAIAVTVLMTACATNQGDFGVNTVEPPPVIKPKPPKLQDALSEPRTPEQLDAMMEPALGFETKLLERNIHPRFTEDSSTNLSVDDIQPISGDFASLEQKYTDALIASDRAKSNHLIYGTHSHNDGFFASRNREYMQFVKSGWVANIATNPIINHDTNQWLNGMQGYVFYLGNNPAKALPSGGQVQYKGTWDFVTNTKKGRRVPRDFSRQEKPGAGNNYSAFSFHESVLGDEVLREKENKATGPVTHSSEFTVDFANKTLTGLLKYNKGSQLSQDRYTVDAKLHGNRFRGNVIASDKENPHFGADSNTLEGGFFGANAEELAGKFLANDNSLFGVFGARQFKDGKHVDEEGVAKADPAFDAVAINTSSFEKLNLDTFGDATKLVINGRSFSLLPSGEVKQFIAHNTHDLKNGSSLVTNACCDNLSYVKFGNYFTSTGDTKSGAHLFLTGERTPLAQMLSKGQFEYLGTWEANLLTTGQKVGGVSPNKDDGGSRAVFAVDFDKKTLAGSLYQDNGVTPSILIKDGVISGNGFNAKFQSRASGFLLDAFTNDVAHVSGDVTGGFYGPNAVELGGYFYSNEQNKDKIAGVFGAKQQVLSDK